VALEHVAVPGVYEVLFSFLTIFRVEMIMVPSVYILYQYLFTYATISEISGILDIFEDHIMVKFTRIFQCRILKGPACLIFGRIER
jgi:hypothetical protein